MQVVFINPQTNAFLLRPLDYFVAGRPSSRKHFFLLKQMIERGDDVVVYVNARGSSWNELLRHRVSPALRIHIHKAEAYVCLLLNGVSPRSVRVTSDPDAISDAAAVICYLHYPNDFFDIERLSGRLVVSANHYHAGRGIRANVALVENLCVAAFVAEANLHDQSDYFASHFGSIQKRVIVVPYTYREKFTNVTAFEARINRAVATGTVAPFPADDETARHFRTSWLQPMRQIIYENRESITEQVDSFITQWGQDLPAKRRVSKRKLLGKLLDWYYDEVIRAGQRNYYSFDMAALYNKYQMSVVPEEVTGLPAIGFVESMACGCAFIGIEHPMYADLGLRAGEHYISYDGTLQGLQAVVRHHQGRPEAVARIAAAGQAFVRDRLSPVAVAERFRQELAGLIHAGQS